MLKDLSIGMMYALTSLTPRPYDASHDSVNGLPLSEAQQGISKDLAPLPTVSHVNVFSEDGIDPRRIQSRAGSGRAFLPIVATLTMNHVPIAWSDPSKKEPRAGSGFLVSPCFMYTNFHAVFGEDPHPSKSGHRIFVVIGKKGSEFYEPSFANPVAWGNYKPGTADNGEDWAMLKFEQRDGRCPGETSGWLELDPIKNDKDALDDVVTTAGYPDNSQDLWVDTNKRVFGTHPGGSWNIDTNGAMTGGMSGGPMLHISTRGRLSVIGMISMDVNSTQRILDRYDTLHRNIGVDIRSPFSHTYQDIIDDLGSHTVENPAYKITE